MTPPNTPPNARAGARRGAVLQPGDRHRSRGGAGAAGQGGQHLADVGQLGVDAVAPLGGGGELAVGVGADPGGGRLGVVDDRGRLLLGLLDHAAGGAPGLGVLGVVVALAAGAAWLGLLALKYVLPVVLVGWAVSRIVRTLRRRTGEADARRAAETGSTYGMDGMAAASGPVSEAPIV